MTIECMQLLILEVDRVTMKGIHVLLEGRNNTVFIAHKEYKSDRKLTRGKTHSFLYVLKSVIKKKGFL